MVNPPRFAEKFFKWFCHQKHLEGLEGDLYELFERRVNERGAFRAKLFYVLDMFSLMRSSTARSLPVILTNNVMDIFFSNLKVAFRQGIKRKEFSAINLIGLTLGITGVLLISLFIRDEVSFDRHISNAENKFRIYNIRHGSDGIDNYLPVVPPVFATAFKENFAEFEKIGRIIQDYGGTIFTNGENHFSETNGVFAEIPALEILDLKMASGDIQNLKEQYSVLLSEKTFARFFGDAQFANQLINIGSREVKVAGLFKDLPLQSHLKLDYVFPFELAVSNVTEERMNSWIWQQFFTYVQLKDGTNLNALTEKVRNFVSGEVKKVLSGDSQEFYYITNFQNIRDIHLHSSKFEWDIAVTGNYQGIVFLTMAASIILIIAILNFINLTVNLSLMRSKEVAIRKFSGARRSQLFGQYITESLIYTGIAGILSLAILVLLLPYFNDFSGKEFALTEIFSIYHASIFLGFLCITGLLAGIQPAILLTSIKPIEATRGLQKVSLGNRKIRVRQILVAAQYLLSTGLIIVSLIIRDQYAYLQNKDMGFNKENLMVIPLTSNLKSNPETTRASFIEHSNVTDVSFCYGIPGGLVAGDGVFLPSRGDHEQEANVFIVDEQYISTMKMRIVAGRDFSKEIPSDLTESFIINETAVKNFGLGTPEEAVGEPVNWPLWGENDSLKTGRIIGVVEDFNYKSLHNEISNSVLQIVPRYFSFMILRIGPGDYPATMKFIEQAYRKFEPVRPFDYEFVDKNFDRFYKSEKKLSQLFSVFTTLAIITAAIGLFGLVSYTIVSRAKEISIRKVLGAATSTIMLLLVSRYFVMMAVCMAIAIPISWYISSDWLSNFAYHINIEAMVFIKVAAIVFLLTLLTVGYHAIKGAAANPAEKLRTE